MATEILLNDGGAPARILPFIAEAAITGGTVVEVSTTSGQVLQAQADSVISCGVALTDAAADGPANIITGHGVILNIYATGTAAIGDLGKVSAAGVIDFDVTAITEAAAGREVAIALEAHTGAASLIKCMWIR